LEIHVCCQKASKHRSIANIWNPSPFQILAIWGFILSFKKNAFTTPQWPLYDPPTRFKLTIVRVLFEFSKSGTCKMATFWHPKLLQIWRIWVFCFKTEIFGKVVFSILFWYRSLWIGSKYASFGSDIPFFGFSFKSWTRKTLLTPTKAATLRGNVIPVILYFQKNLLEHPAYHQLSSKP